MGSLTEIPSRSWKRIEAVFLDDVIARARDIRGHACAR